MRRLSLGLGVVALLVGTANAGGIGDLTYSGYTCRPKKPWMTQCGEHSKIAKQKVLRINSADEWNTLWTEYVGEGDSQPCPESLRHAELDFENVMAVAIFGGETNNCRGYTVESIRYENRRVVVRVKANTYQSAGSNPTSQPWGIAILPRLNDEIILERDVEHLKDQPPKWEEWMRLPAVATASH